MGTAIKNESGYAIETEWTDDALKCEVTVRDTVTTVFAYFDWPVDGAGSGAEIDVKSLIFEMDLFGKATDITAAIRTREHHLFGALLAAVEGVLQGLEAGCTCYEPLSGCCPIHGPTDDGWSVA